MSSFNASSVERSIQNKESVGRRIISKTTLRSTELCIICLLTWNTRYPKLSKCLFPHQGLSFHVQEFLQNDLESRKSKAMLDRFRESYYVCFWSCWLKCGKQDFWCDAIFLQKKQTCVLFGWPQGKWSFTKF